MTSFVPFPASTPSLVRVYNRTCNRTMSRSGSKHDETAGLITPVSSSSHPELSSSKHHDKAGEPQLASAEKRVLSLLADGTPAKPGSRSQHLLLRASLLP